MIAKKQTSNYPGKKATIVASSILVLSMIGLVWYIINIQNNLVKTSALESAKLFSQALTEFRTIYTDNVVERDNIHSVIEVTHDYEGRENAIPLPATLSMELGKAIGKHLSGAETWLYSDYPFPWRKDAGGGLRDEFSIKAWDSLTKNPNEPYYEFVSDYKGRPVLRYATADLMRSNCIRCHNTHPQTPKNDWKVNDVRGVLEIVHPMEAVIAKTESNKTSLIFLAGGIGLFTVLSFFLISGYKKTTLALKTEVQKQTKDLREAKEAAEAASRNVSQIMDSSPDFIFKSRIDNFTFTEVNQTACEYYGYSHKEFLEMEIFDIEVNPPSEEKVRNLYDTTPVGKVLEIYEINKKKNGESFPVHVRFVKLDDEFALANVRDITELRRSEEALAQQKLEVERVNKDLARSNAELQQFAFSASHDLKEPLRTVKIYMQMLARNFHGKLNAQEEKYFGFVLDASTRLEALIHDLLEIARIETQAKPFQPTNLEEVFQTAVNSLDAAITTHGAVVTHDPLPVVMGDSVQLGQLFQNLIGNAVKFYDERPPEIHVTAEHKQDQWLIAVRDNGIGIESEFLDQIFLMFKRLHSRDEYSGGTGVGLALCKKIVDRHSGQIWVESQAGKGSVFYFTLPALPAESQNEC